MTNQAIQPHQQRVIDEKRELDVKAHALSQFIGLNPVFETLDPAEQERMKEQCEIMWQYSEILGARIAAFTPQPNCQQEGRASDQTIEQEIQAKGLTAPRITPADIEDNIKECHYFTALDGVDGRFRGGPEAQACDGKALGLLTFCVLVLRNGFTVTGESACASPENFDAEIGRKIARENAINKVWPLMGYELRSKLAQQ